MADDATVEVEDEKAAAAAYVPWATFKNALDSLAQFTPNQIDRSTFPGMAWSVQNQLFTGLKFLGLMNEKGKPLPALHKVAVTDENVRKRELQQILRDRYAELFKLDLMKATPDQLKVEMARVFSMKGDTNEKAMRFFLAAAEYTGTQLSPLFKPKGGGNAVATRSRRRPNANRAPKQQAPPPPPAPGEATAKNLTARSVTLKNGDVFTASGSFDLFTMDEDDRAFVLDIIDKFKKYAPAQADDVDGGADE